MNTVLTPIETSYKGYQFRSRLEARWAVFFESLEEEWQYEVEGFNLGTQGKYLPDFWLPRLQAWVEVKPPGGDLSKAHALAAASEFPVYVTQGDPLAGLLRVYPKGYTSEAELRLCTSCDRVAFTSFERCPAYPAAEHGWDTEPEHCCVSWAETLVGALHSARAARFEYGESPDWVTPPRKRSATSIYLAGKIRDTDWRASVGAMALGHGFTISGPDTTLDHCAANEEIARNCYWGVSQAEALFAWVDDDSTSGTLAEIGFARARNKAIFVAFATPELNRRYWFAEASADASIRTPSPERAWLLFRDWWWWH